jgi:ABC-type uncharacterized transport system ATPase subunit
MHIPGNPEKKWRKNMIRFDHLSIEYGGVPAVSDLTAGIPSGEVFGIPGRNGAGKSTTFLVLAGLTGPPAGCCRIGGMEGTTNPLAVKSTRLHAGGYGVGFHDRAEEPGRKEMRCSRTGGCSGE